MVEELSGIAEITDGFIKILGNMRSEYAIKILDDITFVRVIETDYGTEVHVYIKNGQFHNEYGPAISYICDEASSEYYLNGMIYAKDSFDAILDKKRHDAIENKFSKIINLLESK